MSYTHEDDIEWEQQTRASRRKILRIEDVLEGTFVDQYRSSGPGTVIRGEPGSSHQPSTPDGVTFMVVRTLLPGERERIAPRAPR
jgi:hypothetical protein